ncbi:hypothetical protein [Pedobacter hiemivivus]|uniref:DUF304 domain-containing protein n=1 Tax=Pedobacter hiemivivus TaxID=2530454 RepID=A0A4R0MYD6_9SPHI|nr:hypothetical protein [Pedobacter hiemivivus]TCC91014.1 hypothetical protein EZ444_20070 [Pedobacter hiemivivus]
MLPGDLTAFYDGVCIYATLRSRISIIGKLILLLINAFLISAIIAFSIAGVGLAAIFFLVGEFFVLRYTLWNLFGEEKLIINTKSLSYQHDYGLFVTSLKSIPINMALKVLDLDEATEDAGSYKRLFFLSYDDNHLPFDIYHTTLGLSEYDYRKIIELLNELYLDQMSADYLMPPIHMN